MATAALIAAQLAISDAYQSHNQQREYLAGSTRRARAGILVSLTLHVPPSVRALGAPGAVTDDEDNNRTDYGKDAHETANVSEMARQLGVGILVDEFLHCGHLSAKATFHKSAVDALYVLVTKTPLDSKAAARHLHVSRAFAKLPALYEKLSAEVTDLQRRGLQRPWLSKYADTFIQGVNTNPKLVTVT
jgi:hypothetical protein